MASVAITHLIAHIFLAKMLPVSVLHVIFPLGCFFPFVINTFLQHLTHIFTLAASIASPVLPYSASLHGWKGCIKLSLEILQVCKDITIRNSWLRGLLHQQKNQDRMWNSLWLGFVLQMSCMDLCLLTYPSTRS